MIKGAQVPEQFSTITRASVVRSPDGWSKSLAVGLCVLLPARVLSPVFPSATSIGILLACLLIPVLARRAWQYSGVPAMSVLILLCLAATPANLALTRRDHGIDQVAMLALLVAVAGFALFVWGAIWARTTIGTRATALFLACGFMIQVLGRPDVWQIQPWKFGFAFPVALAALAVASRSKKLRASIITLAAIGIVSALNDYRTYSGVALATIAMIIAMKLINRQSMGRTRQIATLVITALAAVLVYRVIEFLAVSGLLGARNQDVSVAQIARGGSLIAGARVETPIFFELLAARPSGYAPGVIANSADFVDGGTALITAGSDEVRYLTDYVFAATIKLHSILADLWVGFGPIGIVLAASIGLVFVRSIMRSWGDPAIALKIFLAALGLWHLGFSPIGTNWWELASALALVTFHRTNARDNREMSVR
ncbi:MULTISPECIES: hypothetical protein [unclassified Microbacterium]|uniref:hypothetical protein n=1 Tax=unclassified Microbacterium TaxID=2609290 RepID=UPI003C2E8124